MRLDRRRLGRLGLRRLGRRFLPRRRPGLRSARASSTAAPVAARAAGAARRPGRESPLSAGRRRPRRPAIEATVVGGRCAARIARPDRTAAATFAGLVPGAAAASARTLDRGVTTLAGSGAPPGAGCDRRRCAGPGRRAARRGTAASLAISSRRTNAFSAGVRRLRGQLRPARPGTIAAQEARARRGRPAAGPGRCCATRRRCRGTSARRASRRRRGPGPR